MRITVRRMLLVVVALLLLAVPSRAGAVTYGLGDASGTFAHCIPGASACCNDQLGTCAAGAIGGYYDNSLFRALTGPASAHQITEVRLFVQYDALSEWNGSLTAPGCDFSRVVNAPWTDAAGRVHPAGQSWNDLRASLIEAHADGLIPVVSIAGYPGPAARPAWDQAAPDPTTVAGYWELRCGVRGILSAVSRLPAAYQPHIWEAFNEPDAVPVYNGPGAIGPGACAVSPAGSPGI
ncbi:MAG TPA: hypothetical protein VE127_05470, partial [Solirubrobacteraceae bacterium]|nr:hypothetical protein [Solirubrobacteraceae bacterium]